MVFLRNQDHHLIGKAVGNKVQGHWGHTINNRICSSLRDTEWTGILYQFGIPSAMTSLWNERTKQYSTRSSFSRENADNHNRVLREKKKKTQLLAGEWQSRGEITRRNFFQVQEGMRVGDKDWASWQKDQKPSPRSTLPWSSRRQA